MKEIVFDQLKFISLFGDQIPVISTAFILVFLLLIRNKHYSSAYVWILTLFSYIYSIYLKQLFQEPRPLTALNESFFFFDRFSFPSSHVLFYTTFWGFVFYLTLKFTKEGRLFLHVIRWISAYYVFTVGISRVVLGMHYFQDVIAGYLFGFLFLYLMIWLDKKLGYRFVKNKKHNN